MLFRSLHSLSAWESHPFLRRLLTLVAVLAIIAVVRSLIVQSYTIPSGSMENTLHSGDRILVTLYDADSVQRGDVVVFTDPDHWLTDPEPTGFHASGVLMRDFNAAPSNFRSQKNLEEFFKEQGKFGVYDIDTRFLTKILRDNGALHAVISTEISDEKELKKLLESSPRISEINYVTKVSK